MRFTRKTLYTCSFPCESDSERIWNSCCALDQFMIKNQLSWFLRHSVELFLVQCNKVVPGTLADCCMARLLVTFVHKQPSLESLIYLLDYYYYYYCRCWHNAHVLPCSYLLICFICLWTGKAGLCYCEVLL